MIAAGQAMEAFERFYADDVVMQENTEQPREGKDACRKYDEEFFGNVAEFPVLGFEPGSEELAPLAVAELLPSRRTLEAPEGSLSEEEVAREVLLGERGPEHPEQPIDRVHGRVLEEGDPGHAAELTKDVPLASRLESPFCTEL